MSVRFGFFIGDLVTTTALTTLYKLQLQGMVTIEVFWAPFLFLHLGSVETIAARIQSKEELWRTYTLGLLIVFFLSFYFLLKFDLGEKSKTLTYVYIMLLLVVAMKGFERIWILGFSGMKLFRKLALEGTTKSRTSIPPSDSQDHVLIKLDDYLKSKNMTLPEARDLHGAFLSFMMFVPVFSDIDIRIYKELSEVFSLNESMSPENAFQRVAMELDFLFDVLYSKTTIYPITFGIYYRSLCYLVSVAACMAFFIEYGPQFYHELKPKEILTCWYKCKPEVMITYWLLLGTFAGDTAAVFSTIFSRWSLLWLTIYHKVERIEKCCPKFVIKFIQTCIGAYLKWRMHTVKEMAQHSLLNHCLEAKVNMFIAAFRMMKWKTKSILNVYWNILQNAWVDETAAPLPIRADLKDLIFSRLQKKLKKYQQGKFKFSCLSLLANKGASQVLKDKDLDEERIHRTYNVPKIYDTIQWSLNKVDFTHSILLWHLATDILFYRADVKQASSSCTGGKHSTISKKLSDYMMHLLVKRSYMLQIGISKQRYRDTCSDAVVFIDWQMKERKAKDLHDVAHSALHFNPQDIESQAFPSEVAVLGNQGGKSVFVKGCKLAQQLDSHAEILRWEAEDLWEMISNVWVEMLFSAAYNCDWKQHAYQLSQGRELLTHVALLMAHLGLSKRIRMIKLPEEESQGNVPRWDWDDVIPTSHYMA